MTAAGFDQATRADVLLWLDGRCYGGWTSISVDQGIDTVSNGFSLELAAKEKTGAEAWPIARGMTCKVTLGGEALVTGYVGRVSRRISAEETGISITGRDVTADMVDCSALNTPGSWTRQKLETIATALASPFGIAVQVEGDTGKPFARFALQPGETAFAAIERMARYRGLIAWTAGDGVLRIGNPDSGLVTGSLVEGWNLLDAEAFDDEAERFSQYLVKGQSSGSDTVHGAAAAHVKSTATDAGVGRYRPLLIVAEEQADKASLAKRAAWESKVRAARGSGVQVSTTGWFAGERGNGPRWKAGARALCKAPTLQVDGEYLVERVRFIRNAEDGTRSELTLVPPDAWTQLAEPEAKQ